MAPKSKNPIAKRRKTSAGQSSQPPSQQFITDHHIQEWIVEKEHGKQRLQEWEKKLLHTGPFYPTCRFIHYDATDLLEDAQLYHLVNYDDNAGKIDQLVVFIFLVNLCSLSIWNPSDEGNWFGPVSMVTL